MQLLYHFQLVNNMLIGKTPLFYNLYEFNTGNDKDRYEPGTYYIPYSIIYSFFANIGGKAFGWNITEFIALFFAFIFTFLLARRYVQDKSSSAIISIISILFPYQWATLLGGSPTGFAISLIPLLLLGLDIAVRDKRWQGGLLAGTAVILAYCSDLHVFFFSILIIPIWCIIAFISDVNISQLKHLSYYRNIVKGLLPTIILVGIAYLLSRITASELANATTMASGWSLKEVAVYSPHFSDLFNRHTSAIYIDYTIILLLLAGYAALLFRIIVKKEKAIPELILFSVLLISIGLIIFLALGVNGPIHGMALRMCRKIIPPYKMVRQTAKIFCLMPAILSITGILAISSLFKLLPDNFPENFKNLIITIICIIMFSEYATAINPRVTLLAKEQPAYKAIADDAGINGKPLAIALPLWPGNSHWSSLYQYYASLYDLRLMNGYRPAVPADYFNNIFKRFESLNQGIITNQQLDDLLARGCKYIILHENAFPEKVSPFPVSITLSRLMNNPRLQLLKQAGPVRTFKITNTPVKNAGNDMPDIIFPSRLWYTELRGNGTQTIKPRLPIGNTKNLRWDILTSGNGKLKYTIFIDDKIETQGTITAKADKWHSINIKTTKRFFTPTLFIQKVTGNINLQLCVLNAGNRISIKPGNTIKIPAPAFFHGGYSNKKQTALFFRKDKEPAKAILYAYFTELPVGTYNLTANMNSSAAAGTQLGRFRVLKRHQVIAEQPVIAGKNEPLSFKQTDLLPIRIEFIYNATADITFFTINIER